jgi:hypothetical protein
VVAVRCTASQEKTTNVPYACFIRPEVLVVLKMSFVFLWVVSPCGAYGGTVSEECIAFIFKVEYHDRQHFCIPEISVLLSLSI